MTNTVENLPQRRPIQPLNIHEGSVIATLMDLLSIPSPAGYTDAIVHYLAERFEARGIDYELTRRGAMRVNLTGRQSSPDRAVLGHVDTLGAQVKRLKENGRLELVPIGFWSARFAEGARVTIITDAGAKRGTILPLKASGHTFNKEIDELPISWQHVELRVDERVHNERDLIDAGYAVGDIVCIDPKPEFVENGYINSRHLDDKAGVAAMVAAIDAIVDTKVELPVDCHFLFTISEEVGSGASAVLHGDVAEMVAVDNGTVAPGQNSSEYGVTIAMGDQTGPFDWHLTHHLLKLAREHGIDHQRDVFRYYRCDAASAIEAGNDIRTALITFGIDASHGYERVHIDALLQVARLLTVYVQSPPVVQRDSKPLGDIEGFPDQPSRRVT
jgi:peptidase M42 family hydrolase